MKRFIKKIIGGNKEAPIYRFSSKLFKTYSPYISIWTNMVYDTSFFSKNSTLFTENNLKKLEARLILDYHSIEKGLLFERTKMGFGKEKIQRLTINLKKEIVKKNALHSQILVAYKIMCEYYELHQDNKFNIENYFSKEDYKLFRTILAENYSGNFRGFIDFEKQDFYKNVNSSFDHFSESRKSIRNFTSEMVADEQIEKALQLSLNSPSVCNRQSARVYYIKDKKKIDQILELQAGLGGFSQDINQLLVVTSDVSYFYLVGERYQHYIDGGIYLMNLLYALHYYKIGTCPANWAKNVDDEKHLKKIIPINESEKVICLVAIGNPKESFRVTLSQRRDLSEIFTTID